MLILDVAVGRHLDMNFFGEVDGSTLRLNFGVLAKDVVEITSYDSAFYIGLKVPIPLGALASRF